MPDDRAPQDRAGQVQTDELTVLAKDSAVGEANTAQPPAAPPSPTPDNSFAQSAQTLGAVQYGSLVADDRTFAGQAPGQIDATPPVAGDFLGVAGAATKAPDENSNDTPANAGEARGPAAALAQAAQARGDSANIEMRADTRGETHTDAANAPNAAAVPAADVPHTVDHAGPVGEAPTNVSGTDANAPAAAAAASAAAPAALSALLPGLANILNAAAVPAVEAAVQPVLNELRGQLLDRLAQLDRADTPAPAPVSNEPPPDTSASPPELDLTPAAGLEDHAVALDIAAQLTDRDGSETLGVTIAGVPDGATLSAGTDLGDGAWLLTPDDLPGLQLILPPDFSGTLNLTVTATSHEGGATSSVTSNLAVDIEAVADTPTLSTPNASGAEDHAIALNIAASLSDTSETLG
ncbi:MAG: hypothetical protein LCH62_17290, partial [Proteobacteria bacterium]|nr:hypothetical protein [Pseudomonadota bacterium]